MTGKALLHGQTRPLVSEVWQVLYVPRWSGGGERPLLRTREATEAHRLKCLLLENIQIPRKVVQKTKTRHRRDLIPWGPVTPNDIAELNFETKMSLIPTYNLLRLAAQRY